jgi:hypothetical protein
VGRGTVHKNIQNPTKIKGNKIKVAKESWERSE